INCLPRDYFSQNSKARMSMVRTKIVRFCRMRMVVT
ncbi:poly(glycerol-phosphate) alpha-glucosyltransferase, partial [Lactobacillus paracasei]|nr:poly(glycerol-phosphate) alpha-glucosyltransferase [Lacticaseibacillus paracasei]